MPEYRTAETVLDIARDAVLLDTGVLVAAFSPRESPGRKDYAEYYLETLKAPPLVPSVVIVEAWGMIVGSHKAHSAGLDLLTWLNSPGRAAIVRPHRPDVQGTQQLIHGLTGIDCVDAMLVELAADITEHCNLQPRLPIATFDPSDFVAMSRKHGVRLRIVDMRSGLEEAYETL